jgi:hypothetical protein
MKNLLRFLAFVLMVGSAYAQSNLPACPQPGFGHNCWGTVTDANGRKYVGEFQFYHRNGQGIEYSQDGSVLRSGTFSTLVDGGRSNSVILISNHPIEKSRFPFNTHTQNQTFVINNQSAPVQQASAVNQIKLPKCQGNHSFRWSNCYGSKLVNDKYSRLNGDSYFGGFMNGLFHGWGAYTYADGRKYVGEFNNDWQHGIGIEYDKNGGIIKSGRWENLQLTESFDVARINYPFSVTSSFIPTAQVQVEPALVTSQVISAPSVTPNDMERDRLTAEVEVERKKRQDLEQQLAAAKERDQISSELDLERKRRQELEAQLALVKPSPPQTNAPRRIAHALVIGNAAYPGSGRLDNPVNDANAISQKLRSMGFTVTTVTDANRQKLVQSMAQFRRTAASADISLLYYAGHGVQIFGTNYILPTDVDQTDPAQATIQGVSLNSVVENFLPGKTKLVFLDACRDNALQRTNDRSVSKGLAPISAAEGTLISYATKDGQTAADGVGSKNSPFTQALLEHLNDPQDIAVVLRKVRERVMKITGGKQQPWEYGSLTGGELVLSAIKPR